MLVLWFLRKPRRHRVNSGRSTIEALLRPLIRFAVNTVASGGCLFAMAEYATKTAPCLLASLAFFLWYRVVAVALDFLLVHLLFLAGSLDRVPGLIRESSSTLKSWLAASLDLVFASFVGLRLRYCCLDVLSGYYGSS